MDYHLLFLIYYNAIVNNFEIVAYALLSGVLPALLWLWFWIKEDNLHPEPKKLIFLAFIMGAISVLAAIFIEQSIAAEFDGNALETIRYVLLAATEEIAKLVMVIIIALATKEMDEPIDAMIYCITVALGFAAFENFLFTFNHFHTGDVAKGIITGNMRFMGATLVHVVSSASIGFMIGLSLYKNILVKAIALVTGVILAVALHSAFNLSIIRVTVETDTLKIFAWVWGAIVVLLILFEEIKVVKPKSAEQ